MRAEFQVLIIPFIRKDDIVKYMILRRSDMSIWQFIAGGGESSETLIEAAKRETFEETGIRETTMIKLDSITMIPKNCFEEHRNKIGLYVLPEYSFAFEFMDKDIKLSHEHSEYAIVDYNNAIKYLRYDGNKTALWELDQRIRESNLLPSS